MQEELGWGWEGQELRRQGDNEHLWEEIDPPARNSVLRPRWVIPPPFLALPPIAVSHRMAPFTVPRSCFALSSLPVLLTLLALYLSSSFKALL